MKLFMLGITKAKILINSHHDVVVNQALMQCFGKLVLKAAHLTV